MSPNYYYQILGNNKSTKNYSRQNWNVSHKINIFELSLDEDLRDSLKRVFYENVKNSYLGDTGNKNTPFKFILHEVTLQESLWQSAKLKLKVILSSLTQPV